ncbi:MAG: tetratricopeptide repeat protein [Gomphosphaeria aponina SAG 52.96 = DSM 107014]|uniref:Tetratricopeptide repeat protein n=1 Tax=Gomphosphaeria aponina SAG 52.96 = DSM 107014 TaxID=1521640 RepID=A0A941GWK9_9CHRO|nr:tetratricopeptide repeat protein [Gomphosphaeria aponina SAG 52.96 = DSM 107014]
MNLPAEFDAARYLASHPQLIQQLGYELEKAQQHYLEQGQQLGLLINLFDAASYLAFNPVLKQKFGTDFAAATRHYIINGYQEGLFWTDDDSIIAAVLQQIPNHLGALSQKAINAEKAKQWELAREFWEKVREYYPGNINSYKGEGNALVELGRFEEAEIVFQEFIAKYPNRLPGYASWARLTMRSQQWALAIERWETVIAKFPHNIQGYLGKGNTLIKVGRLEAAEDVFYLFTKKFPNDPTGYENLAKLASNNLNLELALSRWETVIEKFPEYIDGYVWKGNTLNQLGRLEAAEDVFNIVIEKFPYKPTGYENLAKLASNNLNLELALSRWETVIEKFPHHLPGYVNKGNTLNQLQRLEAAEDVFNIVIEKFPYKPTGYENLAKLAGNNLNNLELALSRWETVIEKFPEYIDGYVWKGNTLNQLGRLEAAEDVFNIVIEKFPYEPTGYENLAKLAGNNLNLELALSRWETVIEKFPHHLPGYVSKGNTLSRLGKFPEAEIVFQELREKYPGQTSGYEGLIKVAITARDFLKAEELINQAKLLFPENLQLLFNEANLYRSQYKYREAVKVFELANNIFINNYNLKMNLANSYIQCGDFPHASKILAELKDDGRSFANNHYLLALIKTMSYLGKQDEVVAYIQARVDINKIQTNQLNECINCLLDAELYLEAEKIIKDLIEEKEDVASFTTYKNQLLGIYEFNRIQSIKMTSYAQNYTQFAQGCARIIKETWERLEQKLDEYPRENNEEDFALEQIYKHLCLSSLEKKAKEVHIDSQFSPYDTYEVAVKIINHIQEKTPFSLIRLGDGEGKFIKYPQEYEEYEISDRSQVQQGWWGDNPIDGKIWEKIGTDYLSAIQDADCLGISEFFRFIRILELNNNLKNITNQYSGTGVRGLLAIIYSLDEFKLQNKMLTSCYIHHDLEAWDLYKLIFKYVDSCSVISCHEQLIPLLKEKYNLEVRKFYQIPTEFNHKEKFGYEVKERHFPDVYEKLWEEIEVIAPGEVFLVAAGFLGKIYCKIIKERGGIALDLGSIVDYWVNYITRNNAKNKSASIQLFKRVIKTDQRLKKINHPTLTKGRIYKSSDYCDYNIYQPKELLAEWGLAQQKLLLITGHPRCGSGFLSYLFRELGWEIGHEKMGKDGVASWLLTVKDLNAPWGDKNLAYYVKFKYIIHNIRNPQDAIPSIMMENEVEKSYNYRRNHLLRELEWDLDKYVQPIDKAIASFLGWNKLVELQCPHQVLKVEEALETAVKFIQENSLREIDEGKVKNIIIEPKINNSEQKYKKQKPALTAEDWGKINPELRDVLRQFCLAYNYDTEFLARG